MASSAGLVSKLLRAGGLTVWIKIASMAVTLLFVSALSFWMDKAAYGQIATLMSLSLFASGVGGLGQQNMMARDISQALNGDPAQRAQALVARSTRWVLMVATGVGAVLGLGYFLAGYGGVFAIALLCLTVLISLNQAWSGVARAQGRYVWALAPRDVFWRGLIVVGAAAVAWSGGAVSMPLVAGMAVVFLAILVIWQARVIGISVAEPAEMTERRFLRASRDLTVVAVAGMVLNSLDVAFVGSVMSPERAAEYFPANRLALTVAFVSVAMQLVVGPNLAAVARSGDAAQAQKIVTLATLISFIASAVIALGLLLGFPWLRMVFPTMTEQTWHVLVWLLGGQVLMAGLGFGTTVLIMYHHEQTARSVNLLTTLIGAIALFVAARTQSLEAVAMTVAGVGCATKFLAAVFAWRKTGILPLRVRGRPVAG